MEEKKKSNAPIWIGVGIIVAAIIGVGIYLGVSCGDNCGFFAFTRGGLQQPEKMTIEEQQTLEQVDKGGFLEAEEGPEVTKADFPLANKFMDTNFSQIEIDPCTSAKLASNRIYIDDNDSNADAATFAEGLIMARDQGKTLVCVGPGVYTAYGTVYEGINVIGSGESTRLTGKVIVQQQGEPATVHDIGDLRMNNNTIIQNLAIGSAPLHISAPDQAMLFNIVYKMDETKHITLGNVGTFTYRDSQIELKSGLPYEPFYDLWPMVEAEQNFDEIVFDGINFIPFNSDVEQENVALFSSTRNGNVTIKNTYSNFPFIFRSPNGNVNVEKNIFENDSFPKPLLTLTGKTTFDHNTVYIGNAEVDPNANKGILSNADNAPNAVVSNNIFSVGGTRINALALNAVSLPDSGAPTFTYNNNLIFNIQDCCFDTDPINTFDNIAQQNPEFVDPAAMDFTLQASSPAVGTAVDGKNMGAYSEPNPFMNAYITAEQAEIETLQTQETSPALITP